jgi:hypothetical protein
VAAAASSEDTSLSSSQAGKSVDKVFRSSREKSLDNFLSPAASVKDGKNSVPSMESLDKSLSSLFAFCFS